MKQTLIGATLTAVTLVLSACGAGGEAVPATAQPLSVTGTVMGSPPLNVTVIEDDSSASSNVVLAQGTLGSGANPSMRVALTEPDSVATADLTSFADEAEICPEVSASPSDFSYEAIRGFSAYEEDGFRFLPEGYVYLTDADDLDAFKAGETVFEYWLVDQPATVRGSCGGASYSINLASGWNLIAVTRNSQSGEDLKLSYRHVAAPPKNARWAWSTDALLGFY